MEREDDNETESAEVERQRAEAAERERLLRKQAEMMELRESDMGPE